MEQKQVQDAINEALGDPEVVAAFASAVGKKLIEQKTKVTSDEERYVRNHVVFAEAGDTKGTYMIAKEIEEAILQFNSEFNIRTRTFGKALLTDAKEVKQTNKGRAYFVRAIVEDMKKYAEQLPVETEEVATEKPAKETAEQPKKDKKKKSKKDKKKDAADSVDVSDVEFKPVGEEAADKIPTIEPKDAFDPPAPEVDVAILIAIANDYETLRDYKEHLDSMSRSKLIKHINKGKMPIHTENLDEDAIVKSIIKLFEANLPKEDHVSEEAAETSKKSKKDKKKKKKKSLDSDALADVGKKKKKKKKKNKGK